jgi:arylformamidase
MYDISVGVSPDLPVWPGDPPIKLKRVLSIDNGSEANVSRLEASVHIGTHIDAPLHFIGDGKSVDAIPLKSLIGRAYVVDFKNAGLIDEKLLEAAGIPPRTKRVLFKTRNSKLWAKGEKKFKRDYVAINEAGAKWLSRKSFQLVGVDYLSVAPFSDTVPTHTELLKAGIILLEGLDLSQISQGRYTLYCLPLKLIGSDGAPARAVLVGV